METARIFETSYVRRSFFEIVINTARSALNYYSKMSVADISFVVHLTILSIHRSFIIDNLSSIAFFLGIILIDECCIVKRKT
jgi:hypothetical protein